MQADFDRKRGLGVPTLIMAHEPYLRESGNATNVRAARTAAHRPACVPVAAWHPQSAASPPLLGTACPLLAPARPHNCPTLPFPA